MTEQPTDPTEPRDPRLAYQLPYPGGVHSPLYTFWCQQRDARDVDEMIAQEADDRYHALKDEGRLDR